MSRCTMKGKKAMMFVAKIWVVLGYLVLTFMDVMIFSISEKKCTFNKDCNWYLIALQYRTHMICSSIGHVLRVGHT